MKTQDKKIQKRLRLKKRIRARLNGANGRPRLSVFRSNSHIYAQIIDDASGTTLASASDLKITKGAKAERAKMVGQAVAEAAQKAGIKEVAFDRNGFKYTGRVKTVADSAREAGLVF